MFSDCLLPQLRDQVLEAVYGSVPILKLFEVILQFAQIKSLVILEYGIAGFLKSMLVSMVLLLFLYKPSASPSDVFLRAYIHVGTCTEAT